ncbi:D-sedoheptulose-7-phosphate isomerase [Panacagrimonas sp.]|uniref:D-sedoheptulose-7-phosphate isomerase n=1 Tax=Panacagrimonas sp. TaxID=2480088 RepID=UPI003B51F153
MSAMSIAAVRQVISASIAVKQAVLADEILLGQVVRVSQVIEAALRAGNKVMLAGNGGSAADAQHLAAEFVSRFEFDRPGLASIALNTDTSMLTAIGNDYGYDHVFARQVEANGRAGDVFIGISTSGNSKNVLRAVDACKAGGIVTVALCGSAGRLREVCDHVLAVPSTHTPRIQESHIVLGHAICGLVEDAIWGASHAPARAGNA